MRWGYRILLMHFSRRTGVSMDMLNKLLDAILELKELDDQSKTDPEIEMYLYEIVKNFYIAEYFRDCSSPKADAFFFFPEKDSFKGIG